MSKAIGRHPFGREPFGGDGTPPSSSGGVDPITQVDLVDAGVMSGFDGYTKNPGDDLPAAYDVATAPSGYTDYYKFTIWAAVSNIVYLKGILNNWTAGRVTETLNAPSVLEIEVPMDVEEAPWLDYPNFIVLQNKQGYIVDRYWIVNRKKTVANSGEALLTVTAYSFMGQLGIENILAYDSDGDQSVGDIVRALLGEQQTVKRPKIRLGAIDGDISGLQRSLTFENKTILAALEEMQEDVGGVIWVDTLYRLNWKAERTASSETLTLDSNLHSLDTTEDYSQITTEVVAYGAGVDADRLTATAQNNIATYGTYSRSVAFPAISSEDALQRKADALVAKWSVPRITHDTTAFDLTTIGEAGQKIALGMTVNFTDTDYTDAGAFRIGSIQRDLAFPVLCTFTVSSEDDATETYQDVIIDLREAVDTLTLRDTGLLPAVLAAIDMPDMDDYVLLSDLEDYDWGDDANFGGYLDTRMDARLEEFRDSLELASVWVPWDGEGRWQDD